MNYFSYFSLVILCAIHSFSLGMKLLPRYQSNVVATPSDEKTKADAKQFLNHLSAFKSIAENTLAVKSAELPRLSANQKKWLKYCISANNIMYYKVSTNSDIVYKKMCECSPTIKVCELQFWQNSLETKKISQALFTEQVKQTEAFYEFFASLEKEGLITKYPRTVAGKTVYKAAL